MASEDEWGEYYEFEKVDALEKDAARKRRERFQASSMKYEVGLLPPISPEIAADLERYDRDYVAMHQEVFTESSGLKPLGPAQIDSAQRSNDIIRKKGRLVKCEPRSYGKTTRSSNEILFGVLKGHRKFPLIIAASVEKAKDILQGILTELSSNEKLAQMFPNVCACFEHAENLRASSVKYQTIANELTHLKIADDRIIFPHVPGEPSSGAVIMVRSKDNVRGTIFKMKKGPQAGRVLRPDIVLLDDIQTEQDAENPNTIRKLIKLIKKSILRSGRLGKRIDAIMTITPQNPGDLATHFMTNEPGWEVVRYRMLEKKPSPEAERIWLGPYRDILLNYDKFVRGDKERARLEALKYYQEHEEEMRGGAQVSWDWAYGWDEEPKTEISTLQACYNIIIEEGLDVFETECQCNVVNNEVAGGYKATMEQIRLKIHPFEYGIASESCFHTVCHIDVGKYLLAYTVMTSPRQLQPMIIDYGLWPQQPMVRFSKSNWPPQNIQTIYTNYQTDRIRVRMALVDLINYLMSKRYRKSRGIPMPINLIGVDSRYDRDEVHKVCREHIHRANLIPLWSAGIAAKDKPINEREQANAIERHFYCSTLPATDKGGHILWSDVNQMKTEVHQGWMAPPGAPGSITIYMPRYEGEHEFFFESQLFESPEEDYDPKTDRRKIIWKTEGEVENEFFDNCVGCLALFSKRGVEFPSQVGLASGPGIDAKDYFKSERKKF